jgi:hypothetical protein
MNFEFNVSLHGKHLFATHPRSAHNSKEASGIRDMLLTKFPKSEGFDVSVSMAPARSYGIAISSDFEVEANRLYVDLSKVRL